MDRKIKTVMMLFLSMVFVIAGINLFQKEKEKQNHSSENHSAARWSEDESNNDITPPPGQYEFVKKMPKRISVSPLTDNGFSAPAWEHNGPINVGGRTRALAIDITDENIIFAAGVSGGLWRSADKGASWNRITRPDQNPFVTSVVQDTRQSKTHIWYYGTGERQGSAAKIGTGDGIYKSEDGGLTFTRLGSTASDYPVNTNNGFNWCWKIIINSYNTSEDEVWVAADGYIYKSLDGGMNWTMVLDGSYTGDGEYYEKVPTDILITPNEIYYAAIGKPFSGITEVQGIWRSDDGVTWTNITPANWDERCERSILTINPQNENEVYLFNAILDDEGSGPKFWKYTYLEGDSSGENGLWEILNDKFPLVSPQRGYDMCLSFKPDNPNIIYAGGQILHRSENFLTNSQFTWLDGIHNDFHSVLFSPHNYDEVYAATDGGVFFTEDEETDNYGWIYLNNGYVTSQFYCIAVDHSNSGSSMVIGGTQDQGSWLTTSGDFNTPWNNVYFGDVVQCAIADDAETFYFYGMFGIGLRKGKILPDGTVEVGSESIQHSDALSFGKKFILDPNDDSIIYMSAVRWSDNEGLKEYIWRNDKISMGKSDNNWEVLENTKNDELIIAIAGSKNNPRHRLYYANDNGDLWRVDFANTDYYFVSELNRPDVELNQTTPYNMVDIAVDPDDGDNVIISYMGFNHKSIFYSEDAGENWIHAGGNLEEFPDGTGNGPAIRAVAILPIDESRTIYFAGGSTGLYSTTELNGDETVWVQEGMENLGYAPVYDIDVRTTDYFVAVGTHGSGVYSAFIDPNIMSIPEEPEIPGDFVLYQNYPNPFNPKTKISFDLNNSGRIELTIFDINGRIIEKLIEREMQAGKHSVKWDAGNLASGIYFYELKTKRNIKINKMVLVK